MLNLRRIFCFHIQLNIMMNVLLVVIASNSTQLYFDGKRYLIYTPSKQPLYEPDNVSRIHLRFRTIHPTGTLVSMVGVKEDRLMVQLIHGRLRYEVSRPSTKAHHVLTGANLDDNKWHTVDVLQTGRINEITLDDETTTSLSQPSYESVSVSENIYLGGGVSSQGSLPEDTKLNYVGCLKINKINNRDPISYFLDGNNRIRTFPGGKFDIGCKSLEHDPIKLSRRTSSMTITMPHNSTGDPVQLNAYIRTFGLNGRLLSTEHEQGSILVEMIHGKVNLRILHGKKQLATVASVATINDGLWHAISISTTNESINLVIDGNQQNVRILKNSSFYSNFSRITIGTRNRSALNSFVGCVHYLTVNGKHIKLANNINIVQQTGISTGCNLINRCFPNPCENDAVCTQDSERYKCDCGGGDFYGENCEIYKYMPSCAEYQKIGLKEKSYCLVDADGVGDEEAFTTFCDFDEAGNSYSIIDHNKRKMFRANDGDIKFQTYNFHQLKYNMDFNKIDSLIKSSTFCRQKVVFKCYNAILFNAPDGLANVGWRSRNSPVKNYWGGASEVGKGCACGVNKTCSNKNKLCNCDQANSRWEEDSGYLTDKRYLPVTHIRVTGLKADSAFFYIGPLECFGNEKQAKEIKIAPHHVLNDVCMSVKRTNNLLDIANSTSSGNLKKEEYLSINGSECSTTTLKPCYDAYYYPSKQENSTFLSSRFGLLEIIFVSLAAVAFVTLLGKYVCYDRIYNRRERGELILRHSDDSIRENESSRMMSSSSTGTMYKNNEKPGKIMKGSVCAYWV